MPAAPNSSSSLNWLSRTIAILIFMVGPGLLGSWLDSLFEISFLTPVGFAFGIFFATVLLLIYAKQFTPEAKGEPLPFEDEEAEGGEQDDQVSSQGKDAGEDRGE